MDFMEWAVQVAVAHPELARAIVSPEGEWLDILLDDGRTFRFRPGQLIPADMPENERTARLERLISIGIRNAGAPDTPAPESSAIPSQSADSFTAPPGHEIPIEEAHTALTDGEGNPLILPIVRRADYFIQSHHHERNDSIVYLPLTDFIGLGLAEDLRDVIQPLFFSHLEERGIFSRSTGDDLGTLFTRAVHTLRRLNTTQGKSGVELGLTTVAGTRVFTFTSPADYQSSWFGDLDIIQQVAASLATEYPDSLPLFVPASRTNLFIVMAEDPHLTDFFRLLRRNLGARDTLYPLPHTVASDGWREWIPLADHSAAPVLEELRTAYRRRIYEVQVAQMQTWPGDYGVFKDYTVRQLGGNRHISLATWSDRDGHGSLPEVDFISFIREDGEAGGEGNFVTIRSRVAREVWAEGLRPLEGVWPPRLEARGFPDEATMAALAEAAHRKL